MNWRQASTFFISLLILLPAASTAAPSGEEIMTAVRRRDVERDERAEVRMRIEDRRGEVRERRLLRLRLTEGGEDKIRIQFLFPPDVRDTAFLLHDHPDRDDDRWLYLPSLGKPKRIAGAQKYRNFLGTDFTYDDLGGREPQEDTHTLEGEDAIEGRSAYRIRSVPKETENPYAFRLVWVWKEAPIVLKEEQYDRHGRLRKQARVLKLDPVQGIWTVLEREMADVQERHRTALTFGNLRYNTGLGADLFREQALERPVP